MLSTFNNERTLFPYCNGIKNHVILCIKLNNKAIVYFVRGVCKVGDPEGHVTMNGAVIIGCRVASMWISQALSPATLSRVLHKVDVH